MIPPELAISPSILARRWLIVLHLVAATVALALPWRWLAMAWLLIAAHFCWMRRYSNPQPVWLRVLPEGFVEVVWPDGASRQMVVQSSSITTAWLTVLHLQDERGRLHLALWPDSARADALRQWRVWLRWNATTIEKFDL